MKALSVSENSRILELQIQGVRHESQLSTVKHLRSLGVPENLIQGAVTAVTQEEMNTAEDSIVLRCRHVWNLKEHDVLPVLNGKETLISKVVTSLE